MLANCGASNFLLRLAFVIQNETKVRNRDRNLKVSISYFLFFSVSSAEGLGFRVQGLEFRVQGFRVQGLGFRVQGFMVQGLGFRALGFRVQGFRVQGFRVQGLGFRALGFRDQVLGFRDLGFRVHGLGLGFRVYVLRFWIKVQGKVRLSSLLSKSACLAAIQTPCVNR